MDDDQSGAAGASGNENGMGGDASDGQDSGFTICIKVDGQGNISVGSYPNSEDDGDADDDSTDYKPAKDIKEALTEALDIYRAGGEQSDPDADMASGYDAQKPDNSAAGLSTTGSDE